MKTTILRAPLTLLLLVVFSRTTAFAAKEMRVLPQSQAECEAAGGAWTVLGLPFPGKPASCDLKAKDAGKSCSDSKECEGLCLAPAASKAGSRTTGLCSTYIGNFGNIHSVEAGTVRDWNIE